MAARCRCSQRGCIAVSERALIPTIVELIHIEAAVVGYRIQIQAQSCLVHRDSGWHRRQVEANIGACSLLDHKDRLRAEVQPRLRIVGEGIGQRRCGLRRDKARKECETGRGQNLKSKRVHCGASLPWVPRRKPEGSSSLAVNQLGGAISQENLPISVEHACGGWSSGRMQAG